jgi:hypothetical protein
LNQLRRVMWIAVALVLLISGGYWAYGTLSSRRADTPATLSDDREKRRDLPSNEEMKVHRPEPPLKTDDPSCMALPKAIDGWERAEPVRVITKDDIFEYMDGAGELYLAYGFDHIAVYEYSDPNAVSILVELYYMKTPDDAFGLLSLDWSGEPVLGDQDSANGDGRMVAPTTRALYGKGLLRLAAGSIYARVMASVENGASRKAVVALGRLIAGHDRPTIEPDILKRLPSSAGTAWRLRRETVGYFKSHLVLNSLFYLSHQNILDLDPSAEGVSAVFTDPRQDQEKIRAQLLLIEYSDAARATKAIEQFHQTYLPEHVDHPISDSAAAKRRAFFEIEDGWLGYRTFKNHLAIVFRCPDRASAEVLLDQIQLQ